MFYVCFLIANFSKLVPFLVYDRLTCCGDVDWPILIGLRVV